MRVCAEIDNGPGTIPLRKMALILRNKQNVFVLFGFLGTLITERQKNVVQSTQEFNELQSPTFFSRFSKSN